MVARRHLAAPAEQLIDPVDQRQVVERCVDLGSGQASHAERLRVAGRRGVRARRAHSGARSSAGRGRRARPLQAAVGWSQAWRSRASSRSRRAASLPCFARAPTMMTAAHQPSPSPASTPSQQQPDHQQVERHHHRAAATATGASYDALRVADGDQHAQQDEDARTGCARGVFMRPPAWHSAPVRVEARRRYFLSPGGSAGARPAARWASLFSRSRRSLPVLK